MTCEGRYHGSVTVSPPPVAEPPVGASTATLSRRTVWWAALRFSLAVTVLGSVIAGVAWAVSDVRFLLAFVLVRWTVVFVLLSAPLIHRTIVWRGGRPLPLPLRTPVTALLLACESIVFDVISANVGG